jgi:CubicO group peptidase (beta-lactamase class C family)
MAAMLEVGNPEALGLSSRRLQRIRPFFQRAIDEGHIPGLITLIARHGQLAHLECIGYQDLAGQTPMQPETRFFIASLTKPITAVAALMLYEEGAFQLNDPIDRFLPEAAGLQVFGGIEQGELRLLPLERVPSIRDVLTHTAGFSYEPPPEPLLYELVRNTYATPPANLQVFVEQTLRLPLAHQPGSAWRYGTSHDVLAAVIERVADMPFQQFLQERIFDPLDMRQTGYRVADEVLPQLATPYQVQEDGSLEALPSRNPAPDQEPVAYGGHGLSSTVGDYLRFAQLLLNRGEWNGVRLLSRKTVELMTCNHLSPAERATFNAVALSRGYFTRGYGYGLGVRVLEDPAANELLGSVGSFGWAGILNTYLWIDPRESLIGMIWGQFLPLYAYPIERQFMTLVYQALID